MIVLSPTFSQLSRHYHPIEASPPDYRLLWKVRKDFLWRMPDWDELSNVLGLGGSDLFSNDVTLPDTIVPLFRGTKSNSECQVEEVRSYGRGFVHSNIDVKIADKMMSGAIAVKGAGLSGWAKSNRRWIVQENQALGIFPGGVPRKNFLCDIVGEYYARKAGLQSPVTVYVARIGRGYQVARFWLNPYRLWELTSGPHRSGPDISQPFLYLNWRIELAFALTFRAALQERAAVFLDSVGASGSLDAFEQRLIFNLVQCVNNNYQLSPFTFHLANVSYSGEVSGYDRICGLAGDMPSFYLGVLHAIFDCWFAINWLRCVMTASVISTNDFFRKFQRSLSEKKTSVSCTRFFLAEDTLEGVFAGIAAEPLSRALSPMLFNYRYPDDIQELSKAGAVFFDGLRRVYTGNINNITQLEKWCLDSNFSRYESVRHRQKFSGNRNSETRAKQRNYAKQQSRLASLYWQRLAAQHQDVFILKT